LRLWEVLHERERERECNEECERTIWDRSERREISGDIQVEILSGARGGWGL
jgi:hypothetical protein